MRVDNVLGVFTIFMVVLAWWFFKDPAMASHKIEGLVTATRVWRS